MTDPQNDTDGVHETTAVLDNGSFGTRTVRFETGRLARQAAGSVVAYLDDETMLLSATTASKQPKEHFDFFPLTVDVEERMYAAGRIPGSFFRREGRPGTDAILTCRLIDRPLRPSFVDGLRNEIQVVVTVMSLNPQDPYDVVAINAASASTQLAGLPFSGPIGGVRVALIDGTWVAFPTYEQLERAVFDMVVAGRVVGSGDTADVAIMMVEAEATTETITLVAGGAQAPTEDVVASGLEAAKPFIRTLCVAQQQLADVAAKPTRSYPIFPAYQPDVFEAVSATATDDLAQALTIGDKQEREARLDEVKVSVLEKVAPQFEGREKEIGAAFRSLNKKLVRQRILTDQVRIDGRGLTDIRPLSAEVEVVPRAHGSALFERGETQILGVTTLNMLRMEQQIDQLGPETRKRYLHHYNFPPYSTGETGRVGSPKRREIGHGALAERALLPVLPTREEFPYAIRQVSEALGSQRLDVDGLGLRVDDVAAQRRCAAEGAGRGHRDGPGVRRGRRRHALRRADRHPRRRGRVRRHGLQGRRHRRVRHRAAARHQARRHPVRGARRRAGPGPRRPADHPRGDGRGDRRAGRDEPLRAAGHRDQGAGRQDRRGHRPEGQDDQLDHREDRCRHLDRGRRHDLRRCRRRPLRGGGDRHDQRDRQPAAAEDRRAVPGHGRQDRRLRRVRLAGARQGRPGAHQQAGQRQADRQGRGRLQGRRQDPRRGHRHRQPRQDQPGSGAGGARPRPPTRRRRTPRSRSRRS